MLTSPTPRVQRSETTCLKPTGFRISSLDLLRLLKWDEIICRVAAHKSRAGRAGHTNRADEELTARSAQPDSLPRAESNTQTNRQANVLSILADVLYFLQCVPIGKFCD